MANKKQKTGKKLQPYKEVTVNSRAYGVHTRAARGSKTPVSINTVLQQNMAKTALINSTAKRVHDLLKLCSKAFKEAMLWQVMLGRMRRAAADSTPALLLTLEGMELNSKYPLQRFTGAVKIATVDWSEKQCVVTLRSSMPVHIRGRDTHYCFEVMLLLLGKEAKEDRLVSTSSEWMNKEEPAGALRFSFEVLRKMNYYLVCVHLISGREGRASGTLASQGMQVVAVGEV